MGTDRMGTSLVTSVAPSYDSDKLLQLGHRLSVFPKSSGGGSLAFRDVGMWWDLYEAKPTGKYGATDTNLRREWRTSDGAQNGLIQKGEPDPSPPLTFPFYRSLHCNGFHHEETQLRGPSQSRCGHVRMTTFKTVVTKPLFGISCSDSAILIPSESGWIQKGCGNVTTESGGEFSTCKISLMMVPSHEHGSYENWQVYISSPQIRYQIKETRCYRLLNLLEQTYYMCRPYEWKLY